jgi:hypothetical protein
MARGYSQSQSERSDIKSEREAPAAYAKAREYMDEIRAQRGAAIVPLQNKYDVALYSNDEHPGFVTREDGREDGEKHSVKDLMMTAGFNHKDYGYPSNYSRKDVVRGLITDALKTAVDDGLLSRYDRGRGNEPRSTPAGVKEYVENWINDATKGGIRKIVWDKN